jgi:hypothetical protein
MQRSVAIFLIGAILVTPLWATSRAIGIAPFLLLPLLLIAVVSLRAFEESTPWPLVKWRGIRETILVSSIVLGPGAVHLGLTWNQEFPFVGDHDYHLLQSDVAFSFWRLFFLPVVLLLGYLVIRTRERISPWLLVLVAFALPLFGLAVQGDFFFAARYPGTYYFLLFPLKVAQRLFRWDSPLNALRLGNLLSLPAWLFVIRPLAVRRWPDAAILPFSLFFFFQKDIVYYETATYLEPWALVFILTAIEYVLIFGKERPWIPYLLIGTAALIKEQAILILPFVVVGTWNRRWTPDQRNGAILATVSAGYPFVVYYLFRTSSLVWRTAGLASWGQITDATRMDVFVQRVTMQFGIALLLVVVAMIGVFAAAVIDRARRMELVTIGAAGVFQILFFYTDRISVAWTGYPRFQMFPALLFGGFYVWLGQRWSAPMRAEGRGPRAEGDARGSGWRAFPSAPGPGFWALMIAIAAINLVPLVPFLRLARRPDITRNFIEHYDSAIYFPIDEIIRDADRRGLLTSGMPLRVVSNIGVVVPGYELKALPAAYPALADRFRIGVQPLGVGQEPSSACGCRSGAEAQLGLYVYFTNLGANNAHRAEAASVARGCDSALRDSCARIVNISKDGQTVATLGVGVRRQR